MRTFVFGGIALASIVMVAGCSDATIDPPASAAGRIDSGTSSSSSSSGDDAAAGDDDAGEPVVIGSGTGSDGGTPHGGSTSDSGTGTGADDAGSSGDDDASDSGSGTTMDASTGSDGTVTRNKCTNTYGKALTGSFGRIDGYVVAIVVPASSNNCNGDTTHIHIQISMNGAVYDVAVNVDGGFLYTKDVALPNDAWSEGWHVDSLDYASTLGIHSTDFTAITQSALVTQLESALASANHISAYGTTYTGSDVGTGIHDIHYESTNKDGALFLDPTESSPHGYFFRFSGDTF